MKANKIVFLYFPCMVIVCESIETPNSKDPETNDSREYARIQRYPPEVGTIQWTKHADMLSQEQRRKIEACACQLRDEKDADI